MSSPNRRLENLADHVGSLHREPSSPEEIARLLEGAAARLADAGLKELRPPSRFTLAYEASHALALVALRHHGFRPAAGPGHRAIVFETLDSTLGAPRNLVSSLARYHDRRNRIEYEGLLVATEAESRELLSLARDLLERVKALLRS